ncbi:MAG: hypothetical protein QOG65_802 [Actinomycetota bacterium]|nr:hypothetical protein [Actinomycetota bacterium]
MIRSRRYTPFESRGRGTIAVIVALFAGFSAFSLIASTRGVERSEHRAELVRVMSRQRTLSERYLSEVLLVRSHAVADPEAIAEVLARSATVLLDGGTAPAVDGDDDEVRVSVVHNATLRAQLEQGRRLVVDLIATGRAVLAGTSLGIVPLSAHEVIDVKDPVTRLRILAAITENVALNAARTLGNQTDRNLADLRRMQLGLAIVGAFVALCLGWALMRVTRRQSSHFRALVTRSTDLFFVFASGICCYVSSAVTEALGHDSGELLGRGCEMIVHPDDRATFSSAIAHGQPHEVVLRVRTSFGDWRHIEAYVSDLRADMNVRGIVLNARDITERVRLAEELTHQAFHDGLTALANRALFRDRLELALARSSRTGEMVAVLLFDLDGFKHVNDSLGHNAGDELLVQVGHRLRAISRPSDTAARLGGDEFALLLDATSEAEACNVAQRILEDFAAPLTVSGRPLTLTASGGVAVHSGGDGDVEELLRYADVAMYAAKESGRNRYEVFQYEMARDFSELLGLEQAMRLGLQHDEFSVHYQPTVDIETGAITGVEALLRWQTREHGIVPPARFIPVAETTGLIHSLGELVLMQACAQAADWHSARLLPEPFVVWVNLSGKQLAVGGLPAMVRSAIECAGIPARLLGVEITENAIVDDGPKGDRIRRELHELRDLGVKIALDDFGTGLSSLGLLRKLPIDVIKVDRSFIDGVERDAKNAAITSNVASLAHALGLVALAEGVESHAELSAVRNLGCDAAQGFLFARPAPAATITTMLTSQHSFTFEQLQDQPS